MKVSKRAQKNECAYKLEFSLKSARWLFFCFAFDSHNFSNWWLLIEKQVGFTFVLAQIYSLSNDRRAVLSNTFADLIEFDTKSAHFVTYYLSKMNILKAKKCLNVCVRKMQSSKRKKKDCKVLHISKRPIQSIS